MKNPCFLIITVVSQLPSRVHVTPWTVARQAPLSFTVSQNLLKFMSIESVMPSNHLILYHPFLLLCSIFPSIRVFSKMSQLFASGGRSFGASAASSVLPVNIQGWFPLGLTCLISRKCFCKLFFKNFLNLCLAVLSLHCFFQAFFSCGEQELLFSWGIWGFHCGSFSYCGAQTLGCFSSHSVRAQ